MEDALRPSGPRMQIGLAHPRWTLLKRRWGPIEATGGQRGYVTVLDVLAFVYHYLAEPLTEEDWAYLLPEVEDQPLLQELSHTGDDGEQAVRRRIDLLGPERQWNGLIFREMHDDTAICLLSLRNTPQVAQMPQMPNSPLPPVQSVPPVLPVPPQPPASPAACVLASCRPAPAVQINPLLLAIAPPRAPRLLWDVRYLPTSAEIEEVHPDGWGVRDITKDDRSERAVLPRNTPLHICIAPAAQRWGPVVVRPGIDGRVRVGDVLRKVHRWLRKEVREKDLVALAQQGVEVWNTNEKVRRADVLGARTRWGGLDPADGPDGQTQWWLRLEQ
ncbi:hypothetical protein PsYK624_001100 [Phanerochaete sordida]|uniref:DUF6699 domain-containing protein n=1 Tax=Phanerochaete sordida TaxID=48140 RepID=A0A9P3FX85_9APHY|nr:hypothetical protein PsYK624_001100 [Phanerochaete sordida]